MIKGLLYENNNQVNLVLISNENIMIDIKIIVVKNHVQRACFIFSTKLYLFMYLPNRYSINSDSRFEPKLYLVIYKPIEFIKIRDSKRKP